MRVSALILTAVASTLLMATANAQDKDGKPKSTSKVEELRQERIATLKMVVELNTKLYQNSQATFEAVLEARVQLCDAELETAQQDSERITLYQNLVDALKQYEEIAKQSKHAGRGTEADVLKAKARRLAAEIRLEEAKTETPEPKPQKFSVIRPEVKDLDVTQQFPCQIHSRRHIEICSLQSGYLEEIPVKEGQSVKKGDLLFRVASDVHKAKLDAQLAEVKLAQLHLDNAEKLFRNKTVSEYEVAPYQAKLAKAQAEAKVAEAELNLTMIRAPFDGIIDRLQVHQGSLITERDVLTTLSDNSSMWVYFNVPQTLYLEYVSSPIKELGVKVELMLADGSRFPQPGILAAIEAQFDKQTGNIPFRADFPNPDGVLRHGMSGRVLIHQTLKNAIVIPQRATFETLGKRFVYVIDEDGVVQRRAIVVQQELDGLFVIQEGVDLDDRIVVDGIRDLHDGEQVQYEFRSPNPIPGEVNGNR